MMISGTWYNPLGSRNIYDGDRNGPITLSKIVGRIMALR